MPEMEQIASDVAGKKVELLFQPHVGPFDRGILSSVYCDPKKEMSQKDLLDLYNEFYAGEPPPPGDPPGSQPAMHHLTEEGQGDVPVGDRTAETGLLGELRIHVKGIEIR